MVYYVMLVFALRFEQKSNLNCTLHTEITLVLVLVTFCVGVRAESSEHCESCIFGKVNTKCPDANMASSMFCKIQKLVCNCRGHSSIRWTSFSSIPKGKTNMMLEKLNVDNYPCWLGLSSNSWYELLHFTTHFYDFWPDDYFCRALKFRLWQISTSCKRLPSSRMSHVPPGFLVMEGGFLSAGTWEGARHPWYWSALEPFFFFLHIPYFLTLNISW